MRFALIVSTYHDFITNRLEAGARAALVEQGVADADIETLRVPGAYELAQAATVVGATGQYAAIVTLGCLIRGETPHFDVIAHAAAQGIMQAAQLTGVPVAFGVLTTNTAEEAMARAADGPANKGREAAMAAYEMARLYGRIPGAS